MLPPFERRATYADRVRAVFAQGADLAERAAAAALTEAGVPARGLGGIITFQGRGVPVPGYDTHLVAALGVPAGAVRMSLAATGGAHALGLAAVLVRPRRPLLVVGADVLGAAAHASGTGHFDSLLHRLLLGDGAAAAVVSAEPLGGPALHIEDGWNYVRPGTAIDQQLRAHDEGLHFESPTGAARAVTHVVDQLPWRSGAWRPDFTLVHPGGPHYLDAVAASGLCPESALRHARAAFADGGDTGGSAVLRVLARTYDDPPPAGARGLLLGVGPGACGAASVVRWG
ncbi:PhlD [Streptomyces sp. G45]|uniref:PhlD n=1 Tax=Streptomyces sp. G45 TaxID=3406627 RepID=UPI003C23F92B